jgi:hypothetical protein
MTTVAQSVTSDQSGGQRCQSNSASLNESKTLDEMRQGGARAARCVVRPINRWMNERTGFTGGARLGWVQATWPFARLSISPGQLTISLALAGRYTFAPPDVSGLERCGIASNGIRLVHTRAHYPETIIFWCGGRAQRVLDAAARAGFAARVPLSPPRRGMPFRWAAIAQIVVAWSVLGILDRGSHPFSAPRLPGPLTVAALGMLLGVTLAIQISESAQAWALKPGRSVAEVAPLLRFLQLVGGFLFAGLALRMLF